MEFWSSPPTDRLIDRLAAGVPALWTLIILFLPSFGITIVVAAALEWKTFDEIVAAVAKFICFGFLQGCVFIKSAHVLISSLNAFRPSADLFTLPTIWTLTLRPSPKRS